MLLALTDIPPQKKIWPCFTCSYLDPFNYHHTYSYFTIKRATSHEALELPAWGTSRLHILPTLTQGDRVDFNGWHFAVLMDKAP